MSSDLVSFLYDRLEEEEQAAWAVGFDNFESVEHLWGARYLILLREGKEPKTTAEMDAPLGQHIARHDPERVLAEITAKRMLLAAYLVASEEPDHPDRADSSELILAVQLAAMVYARHPEYLDEWLP